MLSSEKIKYIDGQYYELKGSSYGYINEKECLTIKNIEKLVDLGEYPQNPQSFDLKFQITHIDTQDSHYNLLLNYGFDDLSRTLKIIVYRISKYYIDSEKDGKVNVFDLSLNARELASEYFTIKNIENPQKFLEIIKKLLDRHHSF